jgi:RNA polymerase sigma-70 factor (ECF subfamily)
MTVREKGAKGSERKSRDAGIAGSPEPVHAQEPANLEPAPDKVTPVPTSDRELAERSKFEGEMMQHMDALYAFALKLAQGRDDAEDLVSETVMRGLEKWRQYEPGTNIRAWLFTILYHSFVSRKRRVDKREVHPMDERDGWSAFDVVGETDPEGAFFDSFIDEEVSQAIDALPEEYREALVLSDVHSMRYAEIAEILGVPEGTVKSRLFRARRILQKKLVDYAVEMGYLRRGPEAATA